MFVGMKKTEKCDHPYEREVDKNRPHGDPGLKWTHKEVNTGTIDMSHN